MLSPVWPMVSLAFLLFVVAFFAGVVLLRKGPVPGPRGPYRTPAPSRRPGPSLGRYAGVAAVVGSLGLFSFGVVVETGCAGTSATAVLSDVGTVLGTLPGLSQVPCQIVTAVDGSSAGQVCGTVATDVGTVATILQGILSALPTSTVKAPPALASAPPVVWSLSGVQITIRADLAPLVQQAAKAKAAAYRGAK